MDKVSRAKIYSLSLKSDIEIQIHAHTLTLNEHSYLFLYRYCIAEIPITEVRHITSGRELPALDDSIDASLIDDLHLKKLCCYHAQISDNEYCSIHCTEAQKGKTDSMTVDFLCEKVRFMRLHSTSQKYSWEIENSALCH